jgi:hypothetical protein
LLCVIGLEQKKTWAKCGVAALALVGIGQLVFVNDQANPTVPESFYEYRPPVLSEFKGSPSSYRFTSLARYANTLANTGAVQAFVNFDSIPGIASLPPEALGSFQERLLLATGSMLLRLDGSLNVDIERSMPPFVYDLWIYLVYQTPDPLHIDCALGRTNVKYIIRPARRDSAATRFIGDVYNGSSQPSSLYEDACMMPRAYAAGSSLFTAIPLETLPRLSSPDFNAHDVVILATDPGSAPAVHNPGPTGQVKVLEHDANRVLLDADLNHPGYVVLLDRYDPNWYATIDGREVPVIRANQLFRAVYAGAGRHAVRFFYRQRGLKAGLYISLATLIVLAWLYKRNFTLNL